MEKYEIVDREEIKKQDIDKVVTTITDTEVSDIEKPVIPTQEKGELPPEIPLDRAVRIEILNGCGVSKLASMYGEELLAHGYDIRDTRNADKSNYINTMIYDRTMLKGQAENLAELLGVLPSRIIKKPDSKLVDIDITIVVGGDWQSLNIVP